ncbi:hypothetical protein UABAM_05491 [Candidatus Uabimicrobium amorphum]|uniref:Uncharacterized protein n=1 Tax=Uabimicrobium amorphum TaxID=2596890 RepID=A0A5S9IS11_UABAM|nr:hypothetical protein UABAM_05491 [Candidatus Uabimicrobium amorphum]
MSNTQYYCPICHSHSGCFEHCFDKMYLYYLKHFPQSTPALEIYNRNPNCKSEKANFSSENPLKPLKETDTS